MEIQLAKIAAESIAGATGIENLKRLSGGANQEIWSFDVHTPDGPIGLILRRSPKGLEAGGGTTSIGLGTEALLLQAACKHGVRAPEVVHILTESDDLGIGYVMHRVEGETIARKILRDETFDAVRPLLARQCGEEAARIHAIPVSELPALDDMGPRKQLDLYRELYDNYDHPHPVFELAFRYLEERLPEDVALSLVHGDYRHGNLMFHPETGFAAALDWELAHLGDPMEDLGWICVNSWRFGNIGQPVGGFGAYEDLFAGYQAASGTPVDPDRVKWWETFGTMKWGIMCMSMYFIFNSGMDPSVERAAIGRRASETEVDLMRLLTI